MKRAHPLLIVVRAVFILALIGGLYVALSPDDGGASLIPWDKAQHFIAFFGLAGLAAAALPRRPLWLPALLLLAYGVLIEILQGLPVFHRDADLYDVAADAFGIFCCYLPVLALAPWRKRMR